MTVARIGQQTVEVVESPNAKVRTYQNTVEVVQSPNAKIEIYQIAIEVVCQGEPVVAINIFNPSSMFTIF